MPLTQKQKRELNAVLKATIDDSVKETVRATIERLKEGGTSYADRILAGQAGRSVRGGKDLPPAARLFARLGLVAGLAKGDRSTELELARTLDIEAEYKQAQSAGSAEGGGLLILEDVAADIIEFLRPFSVVRTLDGLRTVTIPRGNLRTPKITSGVSSGYVGEGKSIPSSRLKTGSINLTAKKLATLVAFTNELSTFTGGDIDAMLVDDMLASIGETEDKAFLFGTGTENEPRGITEWMEPDNAFNATQAGSAATLTEVRTDLRKAEEQLLSGNVPMRNPHWIMSPRSRLFLRDVRDTEDRTVYGTEMAQSRTINGIPFRTTNSIPNNLSSGSNESKVILVDASEVVIGDVQQVSIARTDSATIKLDGVDTNLFEADMSAVRIRQWNDLMLRHAVSAAVIEAVKWGATP